MEITTAELTGSPKQVSWAEDIRKGWIASLVEQIETAKGRVARGNMPPVWERIVTDHNTKAIELIAKLTSAKRIIDSKTVHGWAPSRAHQECSEQYRQALAAGLTE